MTDPKCPDCAAHEKWITDWSAKFAEALEALDREEFEDGLLPEPSAAPAN